MVSPPRSELVGSRGVDRRRAHDSSAQEKGGRLSAARLPVGRQAWATTSHDLLSLRRSLGKPVCHRIASALGSSSRCESSALVGGEAAPQGQVLPVRRGQRLLQAGLKTTTAAVAAGLGGASPKCPPPAAARRKQSDGGGGAPRSRPDHHERPERNLRPLTSARVPEADRSVA